MTEKTIITELLKQANIAIDGKHPWDLQVHNNNVFERVVKENALGLGESYMDGWWDCPRLDEFFHRVLTADIDTHLRKNILKQKEYFLFGLRFVSHYLQHRLLNYQSKEKAFEVGEAHYDLGNDLFEAMLDKNMNYTCAYWLNCDNLEAAQIAKLKLVCDKLNLQQGQKVLDIGCGWGTFARFAAKNYGVSVVGITVSKEQKALAEKLNEGLPIEIRLQDYRDVKEQFDHIVSLGMFEHVGYKNYRTYMKVAHQCLKDDGLFLLHTIGGNETSVNVNEWTRKYIFPNGMIPSIKQIGKSIEKLFVMEDWHNFGTDYDKTLMAWHGNFNNHWDQLKKNYNDRFYRMWNYYLLSCAGAFRARSLQLWQIVLSKHGVPGGYISIR